MNYEAAIFLFQLITQREGLLFFINIILKGNVYKIFKFFFLCHFMKSSIIYMGISGLSIMIYPDGLKKRIL